MADVSKLKSLKQRRSTLGEPPTLEEASPNLEAPEVAPAAPDPVVDAYADKPKRKLDGRIDGRSVRRTNRTVQFATRVTPDWDARIRALAMREGVLLVEILERALDCYEEQSGS
ncbi:hypothetical protein [Marinobacter shengliensis]|uniref:hypothetical protein n=1 Tax=Marinobacter shengliensis TaxID=1389223 RepID=UPI002574441A|nr:hypothetical protein [Marinobacter shengliensis]BEH16720.1 hypothetical protein MAALD49_40880 [Marinobacter shengliensis]